MPDLLRRPRSRDTLGSRLTLSFLGVGLTAIVMLAGLTVLFAAGDVSRLVVMQRSVLTSAIASAAGAAWDRHDSWAGADLGPTLDLASDVGADAQIRTNDGTIIGSRMFGHDTSQPEYASAIVVRGQTEGTVLVRFTGTGLGSADHTLRIAQLRALGAAAGLAALLALVSGIAVARRLARPVSRLTAVTRARESGSRSARVGEVGGPGEVRELAAAFDEMADTLDRHEQLRRDLVADLAHELRTPIAILQAGHEALLDGMAEPTPEELGSLRDEVLRLARMVGDLQALAAAEAATLHLSGRECDLADIASVAADSLTGRFVAAGIALQQDLRPAMILGDPRWLHQVVTNLLTNALKYSPADGTVTISTGVAGSGAELRVTDHGMGIPAEEMPRIFDRFWRGQQAAAHTSGSGIGLAVAAELTAAHGGSLTATSQPAEGTEMTLTLPRFRR
jgi:two-component system sensor histidine kinase BaeS